MNTYRISNPISGTILGTYEGETSEAALEAMARDAGYRDYAECCADVPPPSGGLEVVPVWPAKRGAAEHIIISGEGTGEGTIERADLTTAAAKRRLAAERRGGRWATVWALAGDVGVNIETGDRREFGAAGLR